MALVGLGSLIGVVLFGWHVLSSPDMDASEKILAGLIFVIPFGLLAIVFCAFMGLGAAGLMALKMRKVGAVQAPNAQHSKSDGGTVGFSAKTAKPQSRFIKKNVLSVSMQGMAVLWSLPFAFFTFLHVIAFEWGIAAILAAVWLIPAAALLKVSMRLQHKFH